MTDSAETQLFKAVKTHDVDASLRLLEATGGACKARDLARGAGVRYGVAIDGNRETLSVFEERDNWGARFVASLTQDKCKR